MKNHSLFPIILILLALILFNCEESKAQAPKSAIAQTVQTIDELETFILRQKIETLKNSELSKFYTIKDTLLESEGVEWDGLMFYSVKSQEEIFLAESNWQNREIISRVTIINKQIKVDKTISIDSKYADIKSRIDQSRKNDFPDGYLILYDTKNKGLAYIMDISDHPKLFYGISSFDSIPLNLEIESMVINGLR